MNSIAPRHVVIGTAGHIDHGKSALIKMLTGTDPDRLKEEKERGMTTDLGFAFYGNNITIIDVPGHERFVRHMLAGASTIDFVLFVIAADDGIMPQTREHLEILKLLGIRRGIVVLTKRDLVKPDWLELVTEEIRTFLHGSFLESAAIVPVSNLTGEGLDDLKNAIQDLIACSEPRIDTGVFRMPIDRHFIIKGFGTVVAGTILSGSVQIGDLLEILPQKSRVKVRGIEVHNQKVDRAVIGYRAAINLAGVEKEAVDRGQVLAQIGYFEPSWFVNGSLSLLPSAAKPLKTFTRVRLHVGTSELFGRVVLLEKKILAPAEKTMVQFRLEMPAVCSSGDRFVIRTYAPPVTIGGGTIIEPRAAKITAYDEQLIAHLQKIESGDPEPLVEEYLNDNFDLPRKPDEIAHDLNLTVKDVLTILESLTRHQAVFQLDEKRNFYYATANLAKLKERIIAILKDFHKENPTRTGLARPDLSARISRSLDSILFNYVLDELVRAGAVTLLRDDRIGLTEFKIQLEPALRAIADKIERCYQQSGFTPPDDHELLGLKLGTDDQVKKARRYLLDQGILIYIGESISLHRDWVQQAQDKLIGFLKKQKEIRVSEFRDLIQATRKFALPLLIYFDTRGITIKRGEIRVLAEKYR